MKSEEYLTYQKFNDQAAAAELAELFQENGLDFKLEDSSLNFDASFAYNELNKEFRVKLKSVDFKSADKILRQLSLKAIAEVEPDYYLFQFSTDELVELLKKADEWSAFDVVLAEKILKDRGHEISQNAIEALREDRLEELSRPEKSERTWIFLGYLFVILGGFVGFAIGIHLITHKKTLPNGAKIDAYAIGDRNHGYWITFLGIVSTLSYIIIYSLMLSR